MTPRQKLKALRQFQAWRRGGEGTQPSPKDVGELLDWAIGVCDASIETLKDNGHLADGKQCTLKVLRVAVTGM